MDRSMLQAMVRRRGPRILLEAVVNFLLPILIYDRLRAGQGEVGALIWSSAPPILWSVVEFALHRRLDALSLLVLAGIVLSLLAVLGGGSARFLQLRERLVTALIGVAFLGSVAVGRPLIYELARAGAKRKSAQEAAAFEALQDKAGFRRSMSLMTLVWGAGLVAEAGVSAILVFRLSVHDYLVVSPLLGYAASGALALWTFWYARRRKLQGVGARARAGAAPAA